MFKLPQSNSRFGWTRHIKNKMVYYGISQAQIMRIFRLPQRREEGVASNTVAAMRPKKGSGKTKDSEIWIMYATNARTKEQKQATHKLGAVGFKRPQVSKVTMISAWRYPGKTKPGERPKIPEGVMKELAEEGIL